MSFDFYWKKTSLEETNEEANNNRMNATGTSSCPLQSLKLYMSKTDPNALSLFNECNKGVLHDENLMHHDIWYSNKHVKPQKFTSVIPWLCKKAGTRRFTAHSLRIAAITGMNNGGLTDRNIMFMSGHKFEESLKFDWRRSSTQQKNVAKILECCRRWKKSNNVQIDCPN